MAKLTAEEKRWRAADDAYNLMRAEEIKQDKARLNRAKKELKRIALEKEKEAKAAKRVAGIKKKVVKKKTAKRKRRVVKKR